MVLKNLVLLSILALFSRCDEESTKEPQSIKSIRAIYKKTTGLLIDNGPRQGFDFSDSNGIQYTYRYVTTTIINDSIIPVQLNISFLKREMNDSIKSKVFLLPRKLTPSRQQFDKSMTKELRHFLENELDVPVVLDQTLAPNGTCVITFGFLTKSIYNEPFAIGLAMVSQNGPEFFLGLTSHIYPTIPCGKLTWIQ